MSLNKYDPRLKKYQELKSTFICGRNIYEEIMEDLVPSAKGKTSRQSWIITGPRGAGKSHLITHLYREITVDKKLSQTWIPLIFPEEIFKVDSLYRLMIVVFDKLIKEIEPSNEAADVIAQFGVLKKTRIKGGLIQTREQRREYAKELLSLLGQMVQHTGKKLMLLLENLQYLFRDQIPEIDQKVLRSFLHEQPDVLIIVGTALTVFNEVENYGLPFYHFFRIRGMEPLTKEGIEAFLNKIAEFRGDDNIAAKIEANRHHIHTYSILTGGNPRLILFLYELLLDHQLLNTSLILDKVAELTPYFLDKTRDESLQRKLILDSLATGPPAKTATEIADEVNEDQKSITEQLKRLTAESWIHALPIQGDDVKKKEVFYSLRDYFFRIWYQVRMGDIDESEVFCLAELVTLLFDKEQIHERINCNLDTPGYRIDIKPDAVESWTRLGYSQYELNRHKKALESFQKALDVAPDNYETPFNLAYFCYDHQEYHYAFQFFEAYISRIPAFELDGFKRFFIPLDCSQQIHSGTQEVYSLVKEISSIEEGLEAVGRLLLLGKFSVVEDSFEAMMQREELPHKEAKLLDYFFEGSILNILKNGEETGELKTLLKNWVILMLKITNHNESQLKQRFMEFFLYYTKMVKKEYLSIDLLKQIMNDLLKEGIEISEIILELLEALKNPNTRSVQKWMADPLFKEIVSKLTD